MDTNSRPEALGASEAFLAFNERLSRVARVDRPVLILGERGTGKELAALKLHYLSPRWQGPLITLNLAALAPSLQESELFGYEAGAFTGAARRRAGRFETADGGTLFLDELGNTPRLVQEKILRVVEYGVFERVGGTAPVQVNVRIVAATNRNLRDLAARGRFQPDLLDRLSFEVLVTPPLRERGEDILLLARHFAARMARELGRDEAPPLAPRAADALLAYPWPGNVRELKNVVERAVFRAEGPVIEGIDFDPFAAYAPPPAPAAAPATAPATAPAGPRPAPPEPGDFKAAMRVHEAAILGAALTKAGQQQKEAARILGLTYDQFRGLLRKHGGVKKLAETAASR
ncbi:MAG: sigma 54-interacting transcriptional regulator [Deltaproteobacteria bacterium]|nr:sigma 54-interacting transcriptional regulator [Deltaproteobacteria bacterium]